MKLAPSECDQSVHTQQNTASQPECPGKWRCPATVSWVHNKPQINPLETFTGRLLCARLSVGASVCLMELRCAIQTLTNPNPKPNPKPSANPNLEPNTNRHLTLS